MDMNSLPDREKLKRELQLAIRNVNRNLHEWKDLRKNTLLSISYTDIQGLIKNWIVRSLKGVMDSYTVNRMISRTNVVATIDNDLHVTNVHLSSGWRLNTSPEFNLVQEVMHGLDYNALRYDPSNYELDGVSARTDPFYYKPIQLENLPEFLDKFKYETPKL